MPLDAPRLWICGQRLSVAHNPTGPTAATERSIHVLHKPANLISYLQVEGLAAGLLYAVNRH